MPATILAARNIAVIKLTRFLPPQSLASSGGRQETNSVLISTIILTSGIYEENKWNIKENEVLLKIGG